jgi:Mce-associated membrane protein
MATNADTAHAEMNEPDAVESLQSSVGNSTDAPSDRDEPMISADDLSVPGAAAHSEGSDAKTDEADDDDDAPVDDDSGVESKAASRFKRWKSPIRLAAVVGLVALVAATALVGWLGTRDYQTHQVQRQRDFFLQIGRQGALNLTTIDWQHADADIQRVMDSATGDFYEDFAKRSKPFIDVVKKAQSKSVGTVTQAGLESASADQAQVLVAVRVETSNIGAVEQEPRFWRMRISVEKVGDTAKVSKVAFVP